MQHDSHAARVKILKDQFQQVSLQQACILVGILFEDEFVLSVAVGNPASGITKRQDVHLEPLTPQEASTLVADTFGLDCDALFLKFEREWGDLKGSVLAKKTRATIQSHSSVGRLQRRPPTA
jgi:hypothetical protein